MPRPRRRTSLPLRALLFVVLAVGSGINWSAPVAATVGTGHPAVAPAMHRTAASSPLTARAVRPAPSSGGLSVRLGGPSAPVGVPGTAAGSRRVLLSSPILAPVSGLPTLDGPLAFKTPRA